MVEALGGGLPVAGRFVGGQQAKEAAQETSADMQRHVSDRLNDIGQNLLPDTALDRLIGQPGALDRFVDPGHRPPPLR